MILDDSTFTAHIRNAQTPVLAFFGAAWCAPTLSMFDALNEAEEEFDGRVQVVRIEVDKSPKTTIAEMIKGTPTLVVYNEGVRKAANVGTLTADQIIKLVKDALAPPVVKKTRAKKAA